MINTPPITAPKETPAVGPLPRPPPPPWFPWTCELSGVCVLCTMDVVEVAAEEGVMIASLRNMDEWYELDGTVEVKRVVGI